MFFLWLRGGSCLCCEACGVIISMGLKLLDWVIWRLGKIICFEMASMSEIVNSSASSPCSTVDV